MVDAFLAYTVWSTVACRPYFFLFVRFLLGLIRLTLSSLPCNYPPQKMHRHTSDKGFGFHVDNTIGATFQPNLPWKENWADFWDEHRLGHMLKLTGDAGLSNETVEMLRQKTRELLSHNPVPSAIHGDLWGGNKGFCEKNGKVVPVIFDPAFYYGDREADVAMTYLFGGFGSDFYKGYESEWPLPVVSILILPHSVLCSLLYFSPGWLWTIKVV
jgi:hypothetical protein